MSVIKTRLTSSKRLLLCSTLLLPSVSFAQPTTYEGLVNEVVGIINILIPALFGFLSIYFAWKMIDAWVLNAADSQSRDRGRQYLVAAVISFVVMISTWGIVALVRQSFFG
jgi:uncharacterized membrane-anchored protein